MRDFPVFTTENGVASLVLREIPYKGIAYITMRDTREPEKLLRECVDFCTMAGAERIYATGNTILANYPVHTSVWQMGCLREALPEGAGCLCPLTKQTLELWRAIYNDRMKDVPNAATMTADDGKKLLERGAGYFVHRDQELLGIGIAAGETVESVIAVKGGAGRDVFLTLCNALFSERVVLEVASNNLPAIRLYEKLGFLKTAELSVWYDVK